MKKLESVELLGKSAICFQMFPFLIEHEYLGEDIWEITYAFPLKIDDGVYELPIDFLDYNSAILYIIENEEKKKEHHKIIERKISDKYDIIHTGKYGVTIVTQKDHSI